MIRFRLIILFLLFAKSVLGDTPFELTRRKEMLLLGSAALFASTGALIYRQDAPQNLLYIKENIFPLDRFAAGTYRPGIARVSDVTFGLCLMMPLINLSHTHDVPISTQGIMLTEAMIGTTGLVLLAKGMTERPRPFVYSADLPPEERRNRSAYRSFFSAHAALSFCSVCFAASVFQQSNPDSKWITPIWCAGLSAASLTSVLRVMAGKHFPTDVFAGAVVGSVIGWGIPKLHENTQKSASYRVALAIPIQ